MAKLDKVPGNPGLYAFLCDCGYDRRKVTDSERFFACERPVEAQLKACKLTHEFAPLHEAMEKRVAEAAAKKFLAENEEKVAAAKAVLGVKTVSAKELADPANYTIMADASPSLVITTQSGSETKVLKRGPGRPKKESK